MNRSKNDNNLYSLSNFSYDITAADMKMLGNHSLFPEATDNWRTTANHRFENWNYHRIWYVTKGKASVHTTIGNFELEENCAYFIPGGSILSTYCENYMEQYYVDFISHSTLIPMEMLFSFSNKAENAPWILSIIKEIKNIYTNDDPLSSIKTSMLMGALISVFISSVSLTQQKTTPFLPILEYINNNVYISIKDLAEKFHYNPDYLSRYFKSVFGISLQSYIIDKRIMKAKHLLLTTDLSVAEISLQCGYSDQLNFSAAFKKKVGLSPLNFKTFFQSPDKH